jgi:hypothetical protein
LRRRTSATATVVIAVAGFLLPRFAPGSTYPVLFWGAIAEVILFGFFIGGPGRPPPAHSDEPFEN